MRLALAFSIILSLIGVFYIDKLLIPTLDYFGKYVFLIVFNIFAILLPVYFYKSFTGVLKYTMPILIGLVVFLIGVKLT